MLKYHLEGHLKILQIFLIPDVIYEVLNSYHEIGINPKYVCCIYPTAPLLNYKILIDAYEIIKKIVLSL